MAEVADYDAAEVTDREQKAADNLSALAEWNSQSTVNQLNQQLANYDLADQQNRQLADRQLYQNSQKARNERFAQQKKLQSAAKGLLSTAGNALQGSNLGGVAGMLRTQQDLDNNDSWTTLQQNQNTVENAYQESLNQNQIARNDLLSNAEYALRGYKSDMAAQLNNINPSLWQSPSDAASGIEWGVYDQQSGGAAQQGQSQSQSAYWQAPPLAQQWVNTEGGRPVRQNYVSGYAGSLLQNYNSGSTNYRNS